MSGGAWEEAGEGRGGREGGREGGRGREGRQKTSVWGLIFCEEDCLG